MSGSKSDVIYNEIKRDIIDGRYASNTMINEAELAERYSVSKTPVREALTALVSNGFLTKYPRVGYFVKEIDMDEYQDLLQFRCLLECSIAYYLIRKATDEDLRSLYEYTPRVALSFEEWQEANVTFHMAMAKLTGNRYFIGALTQVFNQTKRKTSLPGFRSLGDDVHRMHRGIVDVLTERDYEKVCGLLRRDLERSDEETKLI